MNTRKETSTTKPDRGVSLSGMRFTLFATRNFVFMLAVLAMNFTLMRPSPVDMLFIASFLITLLHASLFQKQQVTRRSVHFTLLLGAWAVSYFVASSGHFGDDFVAFELLAKTFAISIGVIAAFVSMTWAPRHFETFMKVYIASCVIASILGTIGFVTQMDLLTWDGRARGLLDDPNMYGSFLIPGIIFCAYFLSRGQGSKIVLTGCLALVMLGILLSFSRIAVVASMICLAAYIFYHYRRRPRQLLLIIGGLTLAGLVMFAVASLSSAEFTAKLMDRLTFAKSYDLGEEGRYHRYLLVLPMIAQNPIGLGVLQLEKIFPEPIHDIWLSSFVNYGWSGGISYIILAVGSVIVSIRNYRRTKNEITVALLIALVGVLFCTTLHEGEHWRHSWLFYGLVWGLNPHYFGLASQRTPARGKPAAKQPAPPSLKASGVVALTIVTTAPTIASQRRRLLDSSPGALTASSTSKRATRPPV